MKDVAVFESVERELNRQRNNIELIASENFVSPEIMQLAGSVLTNKYAEGYPGKRYYGGCQFVDEVETLAKERLCKIFGAQHANVQPHSGAQANTAVYMALLEHGDKVLGMSLADGGHLTHGHPLNYSGINYEFYSYGVSQDTETIDYEDFKNKVETTKNKPDIDDFLKYCDSRLLDLVKQVSNCLICRDVFYEKLVLVEPIRKNVYDDKKDKLSLSNIECIDVNQTCDDEFIKINTDRKNVIIETLKNDNIKFYDEFIEYLSIDKIIKVCRSYFHDILDEEIEMEKNNSYYVQEGLDKKLNEFYEDTVSNGFYMRIGANTNYFFKTVSYLIKKNDSNLYNKYFYKVFSPKDKPKGKNKAYPLPDKMPATRTIYVDDLYAYYPGVIKIEFYKEN